MKRLFFCVLVVITIGKSLGLKRRNAYRDLNKKVNLLKKSFQREIEELKFEVLDLRTELHLEKEKSARLEKLQNGTEYAAQGGALNDSYDMQLVSETVNELQKDISELKHVQKSLVKVEEGMRENKLGIEQINERANKLSLELLEGNRSTTDAPCKEFLVLQKAFQDEKERVNQFESSVIDKLAAPSDALVALNSDVASIQNEMISMNKEMKENADVVTDVQQKVLRVSNETGKLSGEITEMKSEMKLVEEKAKHNTEQLDDVSNGLRRHESTIADNTNSNERIKARVDFLESLDLIANEMKKKKKELQKLRQDCLQVIRNGGPQLELLMYKGMAIKWKWSSFSDVGHYCKIYEISPSVIGVQTPDMEGTNSLMFVHKPFTSISIVEDEFDFSMCDKLRRN